jgi:hypothetical protein
MQVKVWSSLKIQHSCENKKSLREFNPGIYDAVEDICQDIDDNEQRSGQ